MKILIGSNNKHKAEEIQEIFDRVAPKKVKILTPSDVLDEILDIIEDGDTLEKNALLKARGFNQASGIACIADDTGLEIDALGGKPGVYSARFAGEDSNDKKNREKVLRMMADIKPENRTARFRTVICYCNGDDVWYVEGICKGQIIDEERGDAGFGYDPIFVPNGFGQTFAEMTPDQKNKLSHRGKAIENLIRKLIV
jgi:XTP/dITP diphosphohydrolase